MAPTPTGHIDAFDASMHEASHAPATSAALPRGARLTLLFAVVSVLWTALRQVLDVGHWVVPGAAASLVLPSLLTCWFALGVSRRHDLERRERTGWVFVGLSAGFASVFSLVVVLPAGSATAGAAPTIGAAAHVAVLLCGAVGVLHWVRRFSPAATFGTFLDLACVAVLAYVVSWRTIMSASIIDANTAEGGIDMVTMLATPALGTLLLVAVITVLSQIGREDLRGAELLATFGLGGMVATDLAMALHGVGHGGLDDAWHNAVVGTGTAPVTVLGWLLGLAAIGTGGALRRAMPRGGAQIPLVERSTTWEMLVSLVPFALLGCVLTAIAAHSSLAAMSPGLLTAIGGLLLVRCMLVAITSVRAARTSNTDPLTGAFSHREFQERLPLDVAHAVVSGKPFALLVLDVDEFGLLNESFSHAEGDRYLREVAWAIRRVLLPGQHLFRNGGDEFAIALPGWNKQAAMSLAERIADVTRDLRATTSVAPTLTMGVAAVPEDTRDPHELVQLANGSLYWGKLSGKNSITCYDPDEVKVLSADERLEVMEQRARLRAVLAMARALDARDAYTARHSENVARYATAIATELGWNAERVELLRVAGLLHDVGKIGVRDSTLRKTERLSQSEWEEMREHPVLGARMITGVAPEEIVPWVVSHHECFDGRGYPHRLSGSAIPDGARLLAVADTFDAMTSSRSYRPALSPLRAIDEIVKRAGEQFDPDVVRAFLQALKSGGIDVRQVAKEAQTAPAQEQYVPIGDDVAVVEFTETEPEFQPVESDAA